MKASIKFREDQKPLYRAKIPLNILGFPFQSGIVAGESKDLALNLATFFDSGPSLKIAYRPNDSMNPFSLVFKTGIGHFGSPISSPMSMSAEFNLIGTQNPSFFIHFKPQLGNFSIKKSQSSDFVKSTNSKLKSKSNGALSNDDGFADVFESPVAANIQYSPENGPFSYKKIVVLPSESEATNLIRSLLIGTEASAKTVLPITNRAAVSLRWGFRFPPPEAMATAKKRNPMAGMGISFQQFPLFVMNKIGIEHVTEDSRDAIQSLNSPASEILGETCLAMKRQLEVIQAENGMLRKAMDDLKSEFSSGKWTITTGGAGSRIDRRSSGDKKASEFSTFGGEGAEGEGNEEAKKAY
ncbi:hypothetical protein U1Q18_012768 [Sarracenia purpurea var. burkii]